MWLTLPRPVFVIVTVRAVSTAKRLASVREKAR